MLRMSGMFGRSFFGLRKTCVLSLRSSNSLDTRSIMTVKQQLDDNRSQTFTLGKSCEKIVETSTSKNSFYLNIRKLSLHFLPRGYPSTVCEGYLPFVKGQMVASVFGSAGSILSMQSMLVALGMGAGAIPLAATLNWVIKDGLGQLGGVLFASFVNDKFDADPKRWRMLSSLCLEFSAFLELLTPLAPAYFVFIASIANIGKNVSFLAASASRAAIHKSFASHENLADITAKSGSQSVFSSTIGTALGISIASLCGDYTDTVVAFLLCSLISTASTYYSLHHVTINLLSMKRFQYVLSNYLSGGGDSEQPENDSNRTNKRSNVNIASITNANNHVFNIFDALSNRNNELAQQTQTRQLLPPRDLRIAERFLEVPVDSTLPRLHINCDLNHGIRNERELQELLPIFSDDQFIINILTTNSKESSSSTTHGEVFIWFKDGATLCDVIKGLTNAHFAQLILVRDGYKNRGCNQWWNIAKILTRTSVNGDSNQDLVQRLDVVREAKHLASSVITTGSNDTQVSLVADFADKVMKSDQWLVAVGQLEHRHARLSI